ncbi:MAG TPA: dipeptidase [Tepidisphaeraceae bacterium]|jgi:acetylornithine deacetylase/succinyl-diaminopimelate desuccinylase-like protein
MLNDVLKTIDAGRDNSIAGLKQFLSIPSVSTKLEHRDDIRACAQFVAAEMSKSGLSAQIMETPGHPIVIGRNAFKPGRPTVLFYGHYDVQPAEPLHLWITPAFEPAVRNNAIHARGAADDKGQVWAHLQAINAWQRHGGLPVNCILLIEGEEEIGSDHLADFMRAHKDELKADIAVISDTGQFARGVPAITYGLRGLVYMEIFLTGPSHDLHSGIFGGAVPNPANILCEILATLHDADGRVNIPGFYDDVLPLSPAEREMWKKLPFDEKQFLADLQLTEPTGEPGFSTLERRWARPTCDINGLTAGYQGQGAKTVIASTASAKVSMRLVPNQDPVKIQAAFEKAIRDRCPKGVKIEFGQHGLSGAVLVPMESRAMQLAAEATEIGFGVKPTLIREGGSIPVVALIKNTLGIDTLLIGFGLPDDRVHSPNEKFDLDALFNGTRTAAALYEKLAGLKVKRV